jgi:hypothetical protein
MKKSVFIVLVVILISLSACGGGAGVNSDTSMELTPKPTESIPTPTPKPIVACPQEEVDVYIKEYGYIMEEWDDTYKIAQSTSRMSLSSVIGDLQSIKREISRLDAPECAHYISDITGVAMESSIDALLSFLGQDSDSVVQRKLAGATTTWELVNSEFENFKNSPVDAYMAFNLTTEELEESLNQPVDFVLPENWVDSKIPKTDMVISHPRDWDVEFYGKDDNYIELKNDDGTLSIYGGYLEESTDYTSDSGQLFAIQTYLETEDYDYYNERSANVEVFSQNKVYMVEYSVREDSGDDIETKILSYIFTPGGEQFIFYCETTRDEFAQIDMLQIQEVFGSIRK